MSRYFCLIWLLLFACTPPEESTHEPVESKELVQFHNDYAKGFKVFKNTDSQILKIYDLNQNYKEIQSIQIGGQPGKTDVFFKDFPQSVACNSTTIHLSWRNWI